jgi:hypothetical protein
MQERNPEEAAKFSATPIWASFPSERPITILLNILQTRYWRVQLTMTCSIGVDDSIRHDVELIKQSPFLKKDLHVVGYVLDVDSGLLREVV